MAGLDTAEIRALARIIDELDYYQLLELEPAAPPTVVRRAYHDVSRRFHPDANRGVDPEARSALEAVARRVAEAYSVLRDPRRRRAYDAQLESGRGNRIQLVEAEARATRQARDEALGHTPNGRRFFALAKADRDQGRLESALRNLRTALTFEPDNEVFQRALAEVKAVLR